MNSNLLVLIIFLSSLAVISNQNNLSDDIKDEAKYSSNKAENSQTDIIEDKVEPIIEDATSKKINGLKKINKDLQIKIDSQEKKLILLESQVDLGESKNLSLKVEMDKFVSYGLQKNYWLNPNNISLIVAIIAMILLIIMAISLRRVMHWRYEYIDKVVKDGNIIQFPEETNELIKRTQKEFLNNIIGFSDHIDQRTKKIDASNQNSVEILNNLNEQLTIFRNKAESTDTELIRYKKGYDLKIKKDYLLHLIKLKSICNAETNLADNATLIAITELIDDYLEQENIKEYSLTLDQSIQGQRKAKSIIEETENENLNGFVAKNIEPGYLIKLTDNEEILKEATVMLLKYMNKEEVDDD
jgi:hypothetical protein